MGKRRQTNYDSIKALEKDYYNMFGNYLYSIKGAEDKYREDCMMFLADHFSQIPTSLFFAFDIVIKHRLEKRDYEE